MPGKYNVNLMQLHCNLFISSENRMSAADPNRNRGSTKSDETEAETV